MPSTEQYDAIIIGAGQAGGPLASALAKAGKRTALIERSYVGGTCINRGCTPTKTMVASAETAYRARHAADYGVKAGPVSVDMAAVRRRKQSVVEDFRHSSENRLEHTDGMDLIYGEAHFTGPHALQVQLNEGGECALTAGWVFINTGARPSNLPIPGLVDAGPLDSTSIMELDTLPEHLLVLGGGYVGLEFGQMFRRFGSQVTIVQRGKQLLDREDADVADEMAKIMREDGIEVLLNAQASRVENAGGHIRLYAQTEDGECCVEGSHLLLAAGRTPNTNRLDLAAAGIQADGRGYIQVNERLETNVPGVYALGDVKGGPAFTHISYDDFRIIRTNLLDGGHASTVGRLVPYVVYTDPQLGRVGMSEAEAAAAGRKVKIAKMPMSQVARAIETGDTRGLMKAVIDAESGQLLGCAVLGAQGGEIMSMLEIAMISKLPYTALRGAVFAHPTFAESLNNLFASL
jgi:pyruvate/2-oxoglutarate dehydrogenase complex dihydrolipoamide dehydrogenase (E3) component